MARKKDNYKREHDPDDIIEILEEYIDNTDIPVLKEVCYQNYLDYDYIMQLRLRNQDIARSVRRLMAKKEANLEIMALLNKIKVPMAIFSLKQLGWHDSVEISAGDELKPLTVQFLKSDKESQNARLHDLEEQIKNGNSNTST